MDNVSNVHLDRALIQLKILVFANQVLITIVHLTNAPQFVLSDQLGMDKDVHAHQIQSPLRMDNVFNAQLDQIQIQLKLLAYALDQIKDMIQMLEDV